MAKRQKKEDKTLITLLDSESFSIILGKMKTSFSRSPKVVELLKSRRREEQWIKKDKSVAKRNRVFYRCEKCLEEFNSANIQVDHIEPVIPFNIPGRHLPLYIIVQRLFCDDSNLQILCKEHHKEKSKEENAIRREWTKKTKFIVYETINKINGYRYIGLHECIDLDDGFLGDSDVLKLDVERFGVQNFYRQVVFVSDKLDDAESYLREFKKRLTDF